MKWKSLESDDDFGPLIDENCELRDVESVEFQFDEGSPTGVIITLSDGRTVCVFPKTVDCYGCREQLFVSTDKDENEGEDDV